MRKNDWTQLGPEVAHLRQKGLSNKEICIQLHVSPEALKGFLRRLISLPARGARIAQPMPPRQPPQRRPQAMTEAQIAQLSDLWAAGHTASAIGCAMNVTKNVIIGKVHRLGLPPRPSPLKRGSKPKPPVEPVSLALPAHIEPAPIEPGIVAPPTMIVRSDPVPAEPIDPAIVPIQPAPTPHLRIVPTPKHVVTRTCCWPIGNPGTKSFRFCDDANVVDGKPYCLEHCQRAYVNFEHRKMTHAA